MSPRSIDSSPQKRSTGDGEATRQDFYHRHHPQLLIYVARRVGGSVEAQGVCQETWRTFFHRFDHFIAHPYPVKCLYAIARYDIADFWKQHHRIQDRPMDWEGLDRLAEELGSPPDALEAVDRRIDLRQALAKLPERQYEAICLHYLDGHRVNETAAVMRVGPNGVKNLLKRALTTLRKDSSLDAYRPIDMTPEVHE